MKFGLIIGIGWGVFWIYWLLSAFGTKRNSTLSGLRGFIGVRLGLFVLVILLIHFSLIHSKLAEFNTVQINNYLLNIFGLVLFGAGLALAIWARLYLGNNWGTPMSLKQEPELVTAGPYCYIRHPIYSGILTATLGSAFATSLYWLYVLFIIGIYFIYSATVEEKNMQKLFPEKYVVYKKHTKMLIPYLF